MDDSERFSEKVFSNGDIYLGNYQEMLPHGKGKYTWSDGTVYEGDWEEGKMTGKGQIIWPTGARYEGDFSGGYLHGRGSIICPKGSVYTGAWRMNFQHGLGRKQYDNSDVYDGSWKEGVHEGSGRYAWCNGNTYIGNWKGGKMCGKGVMKWVNGDLFDGFWLDGYRHGSGFYRFTDGSLYFGTWTKGVKDGLGTCYPAGSKHPSLRKCCSFVGDDDKEKASLSHSSSLKSEKCRNPKRVKRSLSLKISVHGIVRNSSRRSQKIKLMEEDWNNNDSTKDFSSSDVSNILPGITEEPQHVVQDNSTLVYEREYMQGVLISERIKNCAAERERKRWTKFHSEKARKMPSMEILERHCSYYLMLNLQLGIRYTVGKITPVPMREVRASDFGQRARIRMYFPKKGSQFTPPHHSINFYWKDYCPMVFRNLREMFKLDAAEYMMSICGDDGLKELSSPGKSGSIFYLSLDGRFVIKTLRKYELKVLLKMLPSYYNHVKEHENTLITKFFGLHWIALRGGKKVRFVVMGNMFCTELRIHRRFDLKGSYQGRFTNEGKISESTTLKDCDLSFEFHMDKLLRESLFKQLSLDCMYLESQKIIDYSLLLGLHFRAPDHLKSLLAPPDALHQHEVLPQNDGAIFQGGQFIPPKGLMLVTHEPSSVSTLTGAHIRGNTLRAFSVGDKEVDLLLPGTARLRVQLGVNMPAQANRKLLQDENASAEVELFEVYDVVIYLGIVDILQEYDVKKKIEHACKSMRYDPMSISAIEPKLYSKRFIEFLQKVFPDIH